MVAAAVAGSAVAGLAGSAMSSSAASKAGQQQAAAADRATELQAEMYAQTREDLAPYRAMGGDAGNILRQIFGLGGGAPAMGYAPPSGAPAANPLAAGAQMQGAAGPQLPPGWHVGTSMVDRGESGAPYEQTILADENGQIRAVLDGSRDPQRAALDWAVQNGLAVPGQPAQPMQPMAGGGAAAPGADMGYLQQFGIPGLTFQPTQAQLEATPGYQFDLSQGMRAVENSAAAKGLGMSGAALKGAARYATGLADKTLLTQQGIFQQNLGNVLNPLMTMYGSGQSAANQTGALGSQYSQGISGSLMGAGNAQAAGTMGAANALASGVTGLGNNAMNYMMFNQLQSGGGGGGYSGYANSGSWS